MTDQQRFLPFSGQGVERRAWIGIVLSGIWLVFLVPALQDGWAARDTVRGVVGLLATIAFCGLYVVAFGAARSRRIRLDLGPRWLGGSLVIGGLVLLAAASCWGVGQSGSATFVFISVCGILWFDTRAAVALCVALIVVSEILVRTLADWTDDLSLAFAIAAATFAMWGVYQLLSRNVELLGAREENARLAVEEERNRFARDLHDILGHSLTVITVKSELAQRLLDSDVERARAELVDLERLSRDALADVRRAVGGYRELSLSGELVRAREALDSAGIAAELPNSTDEVPGPLQELFAWTLREGVTNVIRHSRASSCLVSLQARAIVVEDDGRGPGDSAGAGHGLLGLRERAAAVGAVVLTGSVAPRGFRLEVRLP